MIWYPYLYVFVMFEDCCCVWKDSALRWCHILEFIFSYYVNTKDSGFSCGQPSDIYVFVFGDMRYTVFCFLSQATFERICRYSSIDHVRQNPLESGIVVLPLRLSGERKSDRAGRQSAEGPTSVNHQTRMGHTMMGENSVNGCQKCCCCIGTRHSNDHPKNRNHPPLAVLAVDVGLHVDLATRVDSPIGIVPSTSIDQLHLGE